MPTAMDLYIHRTESICPPHGIYNPLQGQEYYDGKAGFADGKGLKATFNQPYEIIITEDCKTMYVAGAVNYLIRRITVK